MTAVVGLDLSLAATGVACDHGADVLRPPDGLTGDIRLDHLRRAILAHCAGPFDPTGYTRPAGGADLVVMEGLAFASATGLAMERAGLAHLVRWSLWTLNIPYVTVPPATLKKFATGKGVAKKLAMGLAAQRAGYDGPEDDNAIDAWWLRQMGLYAEGLYADVPATAYRNETVLKITWPVPVSA